METQNKKPLEILIIEDNPEFLAVARSVYDNDSNIQPHYATNYEEALELLAKLPIGGVVTDLFFPCNPRGTRGEIMDKLKEAIELRYRGQIAEKERLDERYKRKEIKERDYYYKKELKEEAMQELSDTSCSLENINEDPSGLEIALYCLSKRIPFIMLSHGEDRHTGNLLVIRKAVQSLPEFQRVKSDFLPAVLIGNGAKVDKNDPQTWRDALYKQTEYGSGGLFDPLRLKGYGKIIGLQQMFEAYNSNTRENKD